MNVAVADNKTRAAAAIAFYMAISMGLILVNRFLFIDKSEPSSSIFVSWYQFIVADVLIVAFSGCCSESELCGYFPVMNLHLDVALKVLPLSLAYLLMIATNNLTLQHLSVGSYQIVRSLSVLFNIALRRFLYGETTSVPVTLCCVFIVIGFALGATGDVTMTARGLFFGLLSSVFAALYAILVKTTLGYLNGNEFLLLQYNTNLALLFLTPYVLFNREVNSMYRCYSVRYWIVQTLAGVGGFVLNLSIFWHIKYTSSLTHNLVGTVKSCMQTAIAYVLFPTYEKYGVAKFIGFVVIVVSSSMYGVLKNKEAAAKTMHEQKAEEEALLNENEGFPDVELDDDQDKL